MGDPVTDRHEDVTPSADSPPGGGRNRSPLLGLVALLIAVGLLLLLMLVLFDGGTGPTR